MVEGLREGNRLVGNVKKVRVGICFDDFPVDFNKLYCVEVCDGGTVDMVISLVPDGETKAPEFLHKGGSKPGARMSTM